MNLTCVAGPAKATPRTNDGSGMTEAEEEAWIKAIRQGDQEALGKLLEAYRPRLFNVCLRMVGNREDAAELTQDVMVKVVQHLDSFTGAAALSTWMIRIAMNLSISHLRKRKLRQAHSLESAPPGSGDPTPQTLRQRLQDGREPGPAQSVEQNELIERLYECLDRVEEDLRAVLVLRDIDQMDYQQMAEVLGIPVGTVKSRLFRARIALRKEMTGRGDSERETGGRHG
jgi:RNA polymerase sigma-70 factor (ECF subfamily)